MRWYRITAYLTDESGRKAATDAVGAGRVVEAEQTTSMLFGLANEQNVDDLRKQGIMVTGVEIDAPGSAPSSPGSGGGAAGFGFAPPTSGPQTSSLPPATSSTGVPSTAPYDRKTYFEVDIAAQLTPTIRAALANAGAEVVERLPSRSYAVRIAPKDLPKLNALGVVRSVQYYGRRQTLKVPASSFGGTMFMGFGTGAAGAGQAKVLDALLHDAADLDTVRDELQRRTLRVISAEGRSIRFVADDGTVVESLAEMPEIAEINDAGVPRTFDDEVDRVVRLAPWAKLSACEYTGEGQIVAIADTGLDDMHPDFGASRIVDKVGLGRPGDTSDPDGHGTHVAGTVLGDGSASNGRLRGAAPAAKLYFQSLLDVNGELGGLPANLKTLFQPAYNAGARVHNNSWGAFVYAQYGNQDIQVDEFVARNRDMLIVIAAGNNGSCLPGRGPGAQAGYVDTSSVASPGTAKNGLTVGASRTSRQKGGYASLTYGALWPQDFNNPPIAAETVSGDIHGLAAFSSRGPCTDLRIKPDIVAPGTDIVSTRSSQAPLRNFWGAFPGHNNRYAYNGGTSMACPLVAGCAALVREYYARTDWSPSAALVKASLINGTAVMMGVDATAAPLGFPGYHQGFGRLDMAVTLPAESDPAFTLWFHDNWQDPATQLDETGKSYFTTLRTTKAGELRFCLVWTDPPARALQNALALVIEDPNGNKHLGNDGAAALLPHNHPIQPDPQNNVQIVRIASADPGTYRVHVFAANLLFGPQDFAIVATGQIK